MVGKGTEGEGIFVNKRLDRNMDRHSSKQTNELV